MQLKINTLASKIFVYCNIVIILLSVLLFHAILPQFEKHIIKEKEDALKQLSQMMSQHSKAYLGHMVSEGFKDALKQEILDAFQTNLDFVYYALIPTLAEEEPVIYNREKMEEAEGLLRTETDEMVVIKKAGMLNVINPIFSKHSGVEEGDIKRGHLISGFSLKDQEEELKSVKSNLLFICGCFIIFGNLWGYMLYRHITNPLRKSTVLIKNVVQGDLCGRVESKYQDELGSLTHTLNAMVETWRKKLEKIKNVIESSDSVSSAISIAVNQQEKITAKQASSINEIAATIEELNTNSKLIHGKAKEVERGSEDLIRVSLNGQKSVSESIGELTVIQEYVKTIAEYVLNLSEEAQQIGVILKEVSSIANQTDMLAINAGIRAAKVEEHGREFAIIATEIRDLANQSQLSATKITSSLEKIQTLTYSAVMAMEQGIEGVAKGIELILGAGKTIETAIINVEGTVDSVNEISLSSHQQSLGTNQVTQSVVSINRGMKETAISSRQTLRETEALSKVHQELTQMISSYKI